MMKTDYIESHFCVRCLRETEHVLFTYMNNGTLTCQFCQHTEVVEEIEAPQQMEKEYTVVSIEEENFNTKKRRLVVVELLRKTTPNKVGEPKSITETIKVQYPSHGNDHFLASVALYPNGGVINFKDTKIIADEIRRFVEKE